MSIVETERLTRKFGALTAVNAVSFAIDAGKIFGLVGPNGAGKSTVIKMLTTLLPPTSGRATVAGFDVVRQSREVRRHIGYVPQMLSADGNLTGYENLLIFAKLYDLPRSERNTRVHAALGTVGLEDVSDKLVKNYSGGMIRRLEIAQSVLHHPAVLFLDEPTIGLDPLARAAVWVHIQKLQKEYGTTILLTTHYMEEADSLCNHVAIMHLGQIAVVGTPAALKESIGGAGATMDQVFAHYAGTTLESGGSYRETSRTRRTAQRVG